MPCRRRPTCSRSSPFSDVRYPTAPKSPVDLQQRTSCPIRRALDGHLDVVSRAESQSQQWLRVSDVCPARRSGLADGQASGSLPGRKPRSAGSRSGVWAQLWRLRRRAGGPRCAGAAGVDGCGVQNVRGAQHHAFGALSAGGDGRLAGAVGRSTRKRSCDGRRRFAGERGGAGGWRCLAHEVSIRMGVGLTVRGARPRRKVSMTRIRPPQQGQGGSSGSSGSTTAAAAVGLAVSGGSGS